MVAQAKRVKRAIRRSTMALRTAISTHTPAVIVRTLGPTFAYLDMLVLDHLVIRSVFPNRHKLSPQAWRAAQPLPHQIAALKRLGIRTVVNLRGPHHLATYAQEKEACANQGITFVDYRVRSRAAPSLDELRGARDLFERVEYPILMHCKSGSDRAGLMSALYRHVREGVPVEEAKKELSLKFGHIRQADTGILDYFFERYLIDTAKTPMPFFEWVERVYDPDELQRTFRAEGWANRLVNGILRRE
jgi:uncharacterized protein (TIGR01244 family)